MFAPPSGELAEKVTALAGPAPGPAGFRCYSEPGTGI
jgi:hypothetical protein